MSSSTDRSWLLALLFAQAVAGRLYATRPDEQCAPVSDGCLGGDNFDDLTVDNVVIFFKTKPTPAVPATE